MMGKRITFRVNAVFEVEDGRIAAWREYYDSVALAKQLGIEPHLVVEEDAQLRSGATPTLPREVSRVTNGNGSASASCGCACIIQEP